MEQECVKAVQLSYPATQHIDAIFYCYFTQTPMRQTLGPSPVYWPSAGIPVAVQAKQCCLTNVI